MDDECTTDLECRDDICSEPLIPLGESCIEKEEYCEDGLECSEEFGICLVPLKMAGDACVFGFECEAPL